MNYFMNYLLSCSLAIGGFILGALIILIIVSFPVMWLWNWLMPVIFGLPIINVYQAGGLWLLSLLLFRDSPSSTS